MKIKILMIAAVAAVIGLSSCGSEDARLAGEIAGTWKGSATKMMKDTKGKPDKEARHQKEGSRMADERGTQRHMDGGEMICTPAFTFVRTDGTNGGLVDISADYTLTQGVESVTAANPVIATINGNVNASGTWTVKDGDEVILTLDPTKTAVNVDTTSVALSYAQLTDAPQDSLAAIKARIVPNIESIIKPMLASRIQKLRKLDDVKITGTTMSLEVGHSKLTLTKE